MIQITNIAPGNQGTRETLRFMAGLTRQAANDPDFVAFASQFVFVNSIGLIDAAIRPHYQFTNEGIETLYSPTFNLQHYKATGKIIGDCDDIAMFYAAIFHVLDIPCRFVAMRTKRNDPEFYHVVVEAEQHHAWIRFDATVIPGLMQIDYGQMIEYV